MNIRRDLLITILMIPIFCGFQPAAAAQGLEKQQTPESVVVAYFEALQTNRLNDLAGYMHLEALNKFRNMLMPVIEQGTKDKDKDDVKKLLAMFAGAKSIAELKVLTPQAFFTSFFKGISARVPDMQSIYASTKFQILGHVNEGDLVHVVYRSNASMNGASLTQLEVVSLKQQGSDWRLLLTGEMENLVNLFK
jgi:hypothetical protein